MEEKKISLQSLTLKNFKGIEDFTLSANGNTMTIYGDNATGKTTLADGYAWLLTGKDSLGQAAGNFEVKRILPDGETVHAIDHIVEGVFSVDDGAIQETITLKKVYSEKYTKKRGGGNVAELTGHSTDHFIDGVPKTQREYLAVIASVASPQVFQLLSNIRFFNETLSWQERRKILLDVCGDISDLDVIAAREELADLPDLLKKKTVDDWRKVAAVERAKINKEMEEIPARIDEASRSIKDVGGAKKVETEDYIKALEGRRKEKTEERHRIEHGGEVDLLRRELTKIEGDIQKVKNEMALEKHLQEQEALARESAYKSVIDDMKRSIKELTESIIMKTRFAMDAEREAGYWRKEWTMKNAEEFAFTPDEVCPTCSQPLTADLVKASIEKARGDFNAAKAAELKRISEKGISCRDEGVTLREIIETMNENLTAARERLKEIEAKGAGVTEWVVKVPPRLLEFEARQNELNSRLSELAIGSHDAIAEIDDQIAAIDAEVEVQRGILADVKHGYEMKHRVKDLEKRLKELAAEFERIERGLYLTDLFVRQKVSMLTERINARFPKVRFKLFDLQINGGVDECCETLVNGVPYRNLNEAARIASGCEIAEVLSDHFRVWLPRWIDGAESITSIPATAGQQIVLVVSSQHSTLTIV